MIVYEQDGFFRAARITGPSHNFLGLQLKSGGTQGEARILARGSGGPIQPQELVQAVLKGVAQANAEHSTDYIVVAIEYVPDDTPEMNTYHQLAFQIVSSVANPDGSAKPKSLGSVGQILTKE